MSELETMVCPKCGTTTPNEKYIKDGAFICAHRDSKGVCGNIVGILCKGCNKIYAKDRFGLHGDVYECKECGRVQWAFTELMKERKKVEDDIQKACDFLDAQAAKMDALMSRYR